MNKLILRWIKFLNEYLRINSKLIFTFSIPVILSSCSKEKLERINCSDFGINNNIDISHLNSRMSIKDTLSINFFIPFKNINSFTGDSVNINNFRYLWGGITVVEYINDSMANGTINTPRSRQSFKYLTEINIFEIPNDLGQPHEGAIFFLYKKSTEGFNLTLKLVPLKKGTYLIQFLNSGFRDAICYNRINHRISGYRNTDFTYLLDEAVGRVIGGPDDYYPFNYVLKVE